MNSRKHVLTAKSGSCSSNDDTFLVTWTYLKSISNRSLACGALEDDDAYVAFNVPGAMPFFKNPVLIGVSLLRIFDNPKGNFLNNCYSR